MNKELHSFEVLCRAVRNRRLLDSFIDSRLNDFKKTIKYSAENGDEKKANKLWVLQTIFEVQNHYLTAFSLIKKEKYYKAWCSLEHGEISLSFLLNHYSSGGDDEFCIGFIGNQIESWQSLYPYKMFLSPEMLEKEIKCNICGTVATPFTYCEHKVGDLYQGKLCLREVSDLELLGLSLVENPVQKYSVAFLKNEKSGEDIDHYDYSTVRYVAERLNSPFEEWHPNWTKKMFARKDFNDLTREDMCPCNSKRPFGECCYNKQSILLPHLEVEFSKELPENLCHGLFVTK